MDQQWEQILRTTIRQQLHGAAEAALRGEAAGHSLQPTLLLNDALLKLAQQRNIDPARRSQVVAAGVRIMRRLLVDHARRRKALRRGGPQKAAPLEIDVPVEPRPIAVLDLQDALEAFEAKHPRAAQVVEWKYFGGLTNAAIAEGLGVSPRTVNKDLEFAKAWLRKHLAGNA